MLLGGLIIYINIFSRAELLRQYLALIYDLLTCFANDISVLQYFVTYLLTFKFRTKKRQRLLSQ